MSTFNFTVRATDNAGAYADRAFSINVNDTTQTAQYDRFMALTNTGLIRSQDGLNWTVPDTVFTSGSYKGLAYGNGYWVAYDNAGSYRFAPAATMSWSNIQTIPLTGLVTGANQKNFDNFKFRGGRWIATFGMQNASNGYYYTYEATATDITSSSNFTLKSLIASSTSVNLLCGIDYDPATDTWIALHAGSILKRVGSGPWSSIGSLEVQYATNGLGDVRFTNGLWLVTGYAATNGGAISTSTNGSTFYTRYSASTNATYGVNVIYQNGRIITIPAPFGTSLTSTFRESINGGRTFTNRGPSHIVYYSNQAASNLSYTGRQQMCTYGGVSLYASGPSGSLYRSTDDYQTITAHQTIGGVSAIIARDS